MMNDLLEDEGGECGSGLLVTAIAYRDDPLMGICAAFIAGCLYERDKEKKT